MQIDRFQARELTLLALVSLSLPILAQQELRKASSPEGSTPPTGDLRSLREPIDTTHSWESSTRWNARIRLTSFHNSKTGWATVAAPAAGHRFNNTFSVEAMFPLYLYRLAANPQKNPPPDAALIAQRCEPGDLVFSGHARFRSERVHYQLTGSVSAPTGDQTYGLSAGRMAFDLTGHAQRSFGRFTPTLTAGAGDSTTLATRLVTKSITSLGPLAHFRAGVAVRLTPRLSIEAEGTEQMPIGDQKIYRTKVEKLKTLTVVTGRTVSERNGFDTICNVIFNRRTVFSSSYSHTLRPGGDTVAVGLTYSLRSSLPGKDLSRDDLFR